MSLLFCLFSAGGLPADAIETVEGTGLSLSSDPQGAEIFINGLSRGRTPAEFPSLTPGRYSIRLSREGYQERRLQVTVTEGERQAVHVRLERAAGKVWIRPVPGPGSPPESVLPFDPVVVVDGSAWGGRVLTLTEGFHRLTVRAFGWEDYSETVYVSRERFQEIDVTLYPASFRAQEVWAKRPRFNPRNTGALGATELRFSVTAPGRGSLSIRNGQGETVYSAALDRFISWDQSVSWDGRGEDGEPLPDGVYTALLELWSAPWNGAPLNGAAEVYLSSQVQVEIDSSLKTELMSMSSSLSGLLFAPAPGTLPQFSFQVEGNLLLDLSGETLPMSLGFRVSLLPDLELHLGLGFTPEGEKSIGGSVKWNFLDKPIRMAAALGYGWSPDYETSPSGQVSGIVAAIPLAIDIGNWSLILSPGFMFPGIDGKPNRALGVLGAGVLFSQSVFTAGISAEAALGLESLSLDHIYAGVELRVFPFSSSFYLAVTGVYWQRGVEYGGSAGLGFGMIN
jgi:hypothetical protein